MNYKEPEPYKYDCPFRVQKEDVPKNLLPRMEACLREDTAFCDLDGYVRKQRKRRKNEDKDDN